MDWKEEMEEKADNAEKKAVYLLNLPELLEDEYWHGLMFGIFIGAVIGSMLMVMGKWE